MVFIIAIASTLIPQDPLTAINFDEIKFRSTRLSLSPFFEIMN
jgi:hypothetical protein